MKLVLAAPPGILREPIFHGLLDKAYLVPVLRTNPRLDYSDHPRNYIHVLQRNYREHNE